MTEPNQNSPQSTEELDLSVITDDPNPEVADETIAPTESVAIEEPEAETETEELEAEDTELEDEEAEPEDELDFYDIPKRKEIKAQFPELFKKFPGLEHAIYRNKAYSEIFPTLQDAKEAKDAHARFGEIATELNSGSIQGLLEQIKTHNREGFDSIVHPGKLLATVKNLDSAAHDKLLGHVISNTLAYALEVSKSMGESDEGRNLRAAAQIINKWIYGTPNVRVENNQPQQEDPRARALQDDRKRFESEKLTTAVTDVTSKAESNVRKLVEGNIDKTGSMTDYIKTKAVDDAVRQFEKELVGDSYFQSVIDKLWQNARKENYSESSKQKIRDAVVKKAKTSLPGIIKKVRSEALKGAASRTREASASKDNRPVNRGTPASPQKVSTEKLKEEVNKFSGSTYDFLSRNR